MEWEFFYKAVECLRRRFRLHNHMLHDPISSTSSTVMTLAAPKGKHRSWLGSHNEINSVLGTVWWKPLCDFQWFSWTLELSLHEWAYFELWKDRWRQTIPDCHDKITAGRAFRFWGKETGQPFRPHGEENPLAEGGWKDIGVEGERCFECPASVSNIFWMFCPGSRQTDGDHCIISISFSLSGYVFSNSINPFHKFNW